MKIQIALLLLIALFAASATAGTYATTAPPKTCKYIQKKKCGFVTKKIPVQKVKKVAYYTQQKYVKKTKVAYKHPICKSYTVRVPYQKAVSYKKLVRYQVNRPSTRIQKYTYRYTVKVPYKKRYSYKVARSCRRYKSIKVVYYKQHSKKYWEKYQSTCPCTRRVKKSKKVKAVRKYSCLKKYPATKYIKIKVPTKTTKTKKYWSGKYIKQAEDCYKKEWLTKTYVVKGWKWGKKLVKYTATKKATCYKKYLKTIYYYVDVPTTRPCTKRRQKVKTWKTRHVKIVKKPYTHRYFVTKYKYKTLYRIVKKSKIKTRRVPCVIKVWKSKYVTKFKYIKAYRTEVRVKHSYVTKYRTKYSVAYRKVKKYKQKKYTTYTSKKIKVCANIKTKVCKNDW